ncbi:integrase core domain-containing protein [Candidatus Tisiphia endosymbiont of Parasteatoda lunata]|uniref:integrase core domain-containing protein n=1 Tax=Candidatus Tisiphia endosymbiont of Parasteatoda lunata TaxID=3066275 RepID=UPI00313C635A
MKYDNNLAVIRNILTSFLDHYINLFSIVQHMRQNLDKYMDKYNNQRFHSSIGYKKPMNVYLDYLQNAA